MESLLLSKIAIVTILFGIIPNVNGLELFQNSSEGLSNISHASTDGSTYLLHTSPILLEDSISPEEDPTVSSASLCMSPKSADISVIPLFASTPLSRKVHEAATSCNDLDNMDGPIGDSNKNYRDTKHNGNVIDVNVVTQSTNSIDVLSGGESDTGDTLSRIKQNNNSISSAYTLTGRVARRRGPEDSLYCIAKELLMTERTYKRDLELVTVTWSSRVSLLASEDEEPAATLALPCLALEPLVLRQGAFLARLERCLAASSPGVQEAEEAEYKKICDLMRDYISSTYDAYNAYTANAGVLVGLVESARRGGGAGEAACATLDASAPIPLACLVLRPLHRLIYYQHRSEELLRVCDSESAQRLSSMCCQLAESAHDQLRHSENHAALCQLQRDILGYDKLLVPDREFLQLGCLYKHSNKGLQQRMFFLFSDILVCASKAGGASQFRAHHVIALQGLKLQRSELPHSFTLSNDETSLLLSASNDTECAGWQYYLEEALSRISDQSSPETELDNTTTDTISTSSSSSALGCGAALSHVCWHRATSLSYEHLHLAMTSQLSGYLLRKFKNSHGWQKLWVVFAAFALFFYKSWQDAQPLASLPLLGYSVCVPNESDDIHKEFVFKLQYKNHIYFFRAESQYTYNRWIEVLQNAMIHSQRQSVSE